LAEDTDISGKISKFKDAARRRSLLAQHEKADDRIDTAAEVRAATDGPSFAASK
jgi:hypothetical protein